MPDGLFPLESGTICFQNSNWSVLSFWHFLKHLG